MPVRFPKTPWSSRTASEAEQCVADFLYHARGSGRPVGAIQRVTRATDQGIAKLVSSRGNLGRPPIAGILVAPAQLFAGLIRFQCALARVRLLSFWQALRLAWWQPAISLGMGTLATVLFVHLSASALPAVGRPGAMRRAPSPVAHAVVRADRFDRDRRRAHCRRTELDAVRTGTRCRMRFF